MDNELGTRIRALRKERGLSQEALAQALEVSRQAVTKWEGAAPPPSTAAISEKTCAKRVKVLRIGAWALLAVSVPILLVCALQYFTAGPPIPEDISIVGGADMATDIYIIGRFPSHLFLAALSLFAVGFSVLIGLEVKKWKGKTHDR